jgi:hypothetical protein
MVTMVSRFSLASHASLKRVEAGSAATPGDTVHLLLELTTTDPTISYQDNGVAGGTSLFWYLVTAIGLWPMLTKAGMPGWGALIPIYNVYLQIKLAFRPGWWLILYIVPLVNVVVAIAVALGVARAFGKGAFYGFFLHFVFQPIGFLITGFGTSRYTEIRR